MVERIGAVTCNCRDKVNCKKSPRATEALHSRTNWVQGITLYLQRICSNLRSKQTRHNKTNFKQLTRIRPKGVRCWHAKRKTWQVSKVVLCQLDYLSVNIQSIQVKTPQHFGHVFRFLIPKLPLLPTIIACLGLQVVQYKICACN